MSNILNGIQADHHSFVIPGKIDVDVVRAQAAKRLKDKGESTHVHHHAYKVGDLIGMKDTPTANERISCFGERHDTYGDVYIAKDRDEFVTEATALRT